MTGRFSVSPRGLVCILMSYDGVGNEKFKCAKHHNSSAWWFHHMQPHVSFLSIWPKLWFYIVLLYVHSLKHPHITFDHPGRLAIYYVITQCTLSKYFDILGIDHSEKLIFCELTFGELTFQELTFQELTFRELTYWEEPLQTDFLTFRRDYTKWVCSS